MLLASIPVQAVVAVLVLIKLGRPVLFRQMRPGLYGKPFELVKFRTMLPLDSARGLVDDAGRLTPFGRWLRSTSLDELPTLWNVVRGEMSLVGPRPLLMEYLDRYTPEQARRHEVRPGMTGLAQISGRNGLSWEDKLRLDGNYVQCRTMRMDCSIMLRTLAVAITRQGVSAAGHETMPEFLGSEPGGLT